MGLDTVELVMSFEQEFGLSEYALIGIKAAPNNIFERIRDCTIKIMNVSPEEIGLNMTFVKDLGMD